MIECCGRCARRAADGGHQKDLLEVCKYVTRITCGNWEAAAYPVKVLDAIFPALKGKKMIQSVGYSPKDLRGQETDEEIEEMKELRAQMPAFNRSAGSVAWHWCNELCDWMDRETGELLSEHGYVHAAPG